MPADESLWYDVPAFEEIIVNQRRRALLEANQNVVYRSHSNWDALPRDGIPDQAVAALGFPDLREVARARFFAIHELARPLAAAEIRARAAQALGYDDCRLFGDPAKRVRRFAFLIGGFGENQLHMPQVAHAMGAEALIIGEMSEFIPRCWPIVCPTFRSVTSRAARWHSDLGLTPSL